MVTGLNAEVTSQLEDVSKQPLLSTDAVDSRLMVCSGPYALYEAHLDQSY